VTAKKHLRTGEPLLYNFGRLVFLIYLKLLYRIKFVNRSNIPGRKPFIICANHISWLDPMAVAAAFPAWYKINYMAKKELFNNIILKFLLPLAGAFPVNRQEADLIAIKKAYLVLKEGNVLGLFPEGTRSRNGIMQKAYNGAALIAVRSGVPILPVAVEGPYLLFKPVKVHVGQPFVLPPLVYEQKNDKREQLDAMSDMIMNKISAMLPEQSKI
jgi:1-acyl-sn-glycerol-3-phosphate acyltransferase